jgi:DNA-binding MarR family transcriptional regulator
MIAFQSPLPSSMPQRPKPPKPVFVDKRKPAPDIARSLKLDHGLGFLVRLLETRATALYEKLTAQSEITPRQFGAMLTLHQHGTMTLTELATHIRVDRSTLGEMINRMSDRGLIRKEANDADRRSATVTLAKSGEQALLRLVAGVAQLQEELLAPLAPADRAHFLRCMKLVAEPPAKSGRD